MDTLEKVKRLKDLGFCIKDLAYATGISFNHIYTYSRGQRNISETARLKIETAIEDLKKNVGGIK